MCSERVHTLSVPRSPSSSTLAARRGLVLALLPLVLCFELEESLWRLVVGSGSRSERVRHGYRLLSEAREDKEDGVRAAVSRDFSTSGRRD